MKFNKNEFGWKEKVSVNTNNSDKLDKVEFERMNLYNISSYESLIIQGYPLDMATYREDISNGDVYNKRYINVDKNISNIITTKTDIIVSIIYEENGKKKIFNQVGFYSSMNYFRNNISFPINNSSISMQVSLFKNKQYNENLELINSEKCSILLNFGNQDEDTIKLLDSFEYRISIRNANVLTKTNTQEYTPIGDYNPATKKYVDDAIENIEITGGSNINDTTASATTTYSSNKIESIKEGLSSQIKDIGNATLNKIEVLEEDPTDNLYEGRIWLYKQPDLSCASITLDQTNVELTADNKTVTLVATVEPSNTIDNIIWSSSEPGVATVVNGLVTAKSNGSTVITASCGSQSATCSITVSGFVEQEIGTSNLVLSLSGSDFTNSPQTTTLSDNSGNGNDFTASGFSYTTSSGSNGNGGIVADGTDDKLTISTLNNMNGTNGYTIVMKCSINNLSQTSKYFVEFDENISSSVIHQLSIIYGFNSKGIQLYDGVNIHNININITDTNIHTIAFSYHGTTLTGYLDGAEVSSVTIGTNYLATDLIKGVIFNSTSTKTTTEHINATLYELRLYNSGMTSSEISNITTQLG